MPACLLSVFECVIFQFGTTSMLRFNWSFFLLFYMHWQHPRKEHEMHFERTKPVKLKSCMVLLCLAYIQHSASELHEAFTNTSHVSTQEFKN